MQEPKTDFFHYRVRRGARPSCTLNHMDEACSDIYTSDDVSYGPSDIPKDYFSDFGEMWNNWRLGIPDDSSVHPWDHYQGQLFGTSRTPSQHPILYRDSSSILFPAKEGFFAGFGISGPALFLAFFFIMFLLYRGSWPQKN